jgi:hypothetical protein|tara:strand:- start:668 stop:952 length:285 start_codon:yes stop_codon:yes gene_type:complete
LINLGPSCTSGRQKRLSGDRNDFFVGQKISQTELATNGCLLALAGLQVCKIDPPWPEKQTILAMAAFAWHKPQFWCPENVANRDGQKTCQSGPT